MPTSWLDDRSIRARIVMLALAILLPAAATLAWFLAEDVRQARDAAHEKVRLVAVGSARDLQQLLDQAERGLDHLATLEAVRSLSAGACDTDAARLVLESSGAVAISVRDGGGREVCIQPARPGGSTGPAGALVSSDRLAVSGVFDGAGHGDHLVAWTYPIRDAAGSRIGLLALEIDLMTLNRQLFLAPRDDALVTVVDANRAIVLRSADAERFIGHLPRSDSVNLVGPAREGFVEAVARDGVPRLFAYVTLPHVDWQVFSGMPTTAVFADYHSNLRRTIGITAGLVLAALVLAWRLSAAIVKPVTQLRAAAVRAAAGDAAARGPVHGPPEVRALAQAFNDLLDARALSDSRLRGVFDAALDGIITVDGAQRIVDANPAAAQMFRSTPAEMIGAPLDRFIPARFRDGHRSQVREFGDRATPARPMGAQRDVTGLRADGTEFPLEGSISQVNIAGQRMFTAIHRDVTERRRIESAMEESEARLRRLMTHLPEAVFVNTGGRITFANRAACLLFGTDEANLLGRSPLEFIHADSRAVVQGRIAALTPRQPVAPLADVKVVRPDGTTRDVQSLGTLIEHDGDRSMLVVMRDVSDLKLAQAELEASHADLRRLVVALDRVQEEERKRIARELHDDLQQTLAAMLMDIGNARKHLEVDPGHAGSLLSRVEGLTAAAIGSTRRIIGDLRPQVLEDLGLPAALEALALRIASRYAIGCDVDIDPALEDDGDVEPGSATCLYRVAQEALANAVRHGHCRAVRLSLRRAEAGQLSLRVSDDGVGLDPADLRKPNSFGLLGMRERVRAAGGTLRIDAGPDRGTTLTVILPAAAARDPQNSADSVEEGVTHGAAAPLPFGAVHGRVGGADQA